MKWEAEAFENTDPGPEWSGQALAPPRAGRTGCGGPAPRVHRRLSLRLWLPVWFFGTCEKVSHVTSPYPGDGGRLEGSLCGVSQVSMVETDSSRNCCLSCVKSDQAIAAEGGWQAQVWQVLAPWGAARTGSRECGGPDTDSFASQIWVSCVLSPGALDTQGTWHPTRQHLHIRLIALAVPRDKMLWKRSIWLLLSMYLNCLN